jgi:hypothetical protein
MAGLGALRNLAKPGVDPKNDAVEPRNLQLVEKIPDFRLFSGVLGRNV